MSNIYIHRNIVVGFHGGEKDTLLKVLNDPAMNLSMSINDYDWLGSGVYFWLNDPERAFQWAKENKKCENPFVLGAIIDLGNCLDLSVQSSLDALKASYDDLSNHGKVLNKLNKKRDAGNFALIRPLDCMVINYSCEMIAKTRPDATINTIIGYFEEGGFLYPGTDIHALSHAQICVRTAEISILGYFLPKVNAS